MHEWMLNFSNWIMKSDKTNYLQMIVFIETERIEIMNYLIKHTISWQKAVTMAINFFQTL